MATPTPIFQYDFATQQPPEVRREGGAMYPADNKCLRLTKTITNPDNSITPVPKNWGRAIYINPVPFSNQTTFQTTIKFTVKHNANPADGLVFFMGNYEGHAFPPNPCDGNFGIFDPQSGEAPNVFAVEFATFLNGKWDPHLGIDIESRNSKETTSVGDQSYIRHHVTLTIKYVGGVITATVQTDLHSGGCTTILSYDDLSTIFTCDAVQVGLGASTGKHVAFQDVYYWDFYSPAPMSN